MKKQELVEIIRTLVKEEVNNALPQILMEVLAEKITQNSSALVESIDLTQSSQVFTKKPVLKVGVDSSQKRAQPQTLKVFSSNPILNKVLNETVGGIPLENTSTGPTAIDMMKSLPKEVLTENKEVAAVANALTRDYSKLIKAIDQKSKSRRL